MTKEQWDRIVERAKKEGWKAIPSPYDERDFTFKSVLKELKDLPRRIDLGGYVPFILDQKTCGICVAKGISNILNAYCNHEGNMPDGGLSSMFLYTRCKQEDDIPDLEGTHPRVALKVAQKEGTCSSSLLPFNGNCKPLPELSQAMKVEALSYRLERYARLWTIDEIKQALASGYLVAVGTIVTEKNWNDGWILAPEGRILGFHLTFLTGYDDDLEYKGYKGFFKGVNSWGKKWGLQGRYNMSYHFATWEMVDLPGFFALQEAWLLDYGFPLDSKEIIVEMWIDNPQALVNGQAVWVDPMDRSVTPILHRNRTMLPLRFIAETLGVDIGWDHQEKKVTLVRGD